MCCALEYFFQLRGRWGRLDSHWELTLSFQVIKHSIYTVLDQRHNIDLTDAITGMHSFQSTLKMSPLCFIHLCVLHIYVFKSIKYWIRRSWIALTGSPGNPGGPCGPGGPSLPWEENRNTVGQDKLLRCFCLLKIYQIQSLTRGSSEKQVLQPMSHSMKFLGFLLVYIRGPSFHMKHPVLFTSCYRWRNHWNHCGVFFLMYYYI